VLSLLSSVPIFKACRLQECARRQGGAPAAASAATEM
jgi:hypothetical protein